MLILKISFTECPFIKMQAIKRVYWRKLMLIFYICLFCKHYTLSAKIMKLTWRPKHSFSCWGLISSNTDVNKHLSSKNSGDLPWLQKMEKRNFQLRTTFFTLLSLFAIMEKFLWRTAQIYRYHSNLTPSETECVQGPRCYSAIRQVKYTESAQLPWVMPSGE